MKTTYTPILKALKAELDALSNTKAEHASSVLPLFEIAKLSDSIRKKKCYQESAAIKEAYLDDVSRGIGSVWAGRLAMFDTYQWAPDATVESGQHVIPYLYSSLTDVGVDVIPVVGYDRWGVDEYRLALNSIRDFHRGDYCIRFDSLALDDAAEPEFFKENVDEILDDLGLAPSRCRVVLDLGDVTSLSLDALFEKVDELFQQLIPYKFSSFSIVGCSLPKTIDGAVKKPDSCGNVIRKEMLLWRSLRQQYPKVPMSFGDYGVRGPNTNEGVRSPHTNGKIRYTIDKEYFIARGHSMSWPGKGEQMWRLAQTIIESPYYMGEEFSWGDEQIAECSRRKFKGAAAQWITIDTNHHIAYAVVEIEEFERQLAATQSRIREDL